MQTSFWLSLRRLASVLFLLGGMGGMVAGAAQAQDASIRDLDFEKDGQALVVTYDLIGQEGEEYEVTLLYSASAGDVFDYEPKSVTGDVGENVESGLDKRIVWSVLEDFPSGIQSPAVQFKIIAEEEGGGWGWFIASLLAGSGGTATGIATGVLPCFSFIPGSISGTLCPGQEKRGRGVMAGERNRLRPSRSPRVLLPIERAGENRGIISERSFRAFCPGNLPNTVFGISTRSVTCRH